MGPGLPDARKWGGKTRRGGARATATKAKQITHMRRRDELGTWSYTAAFGTARRAQGLDEHRWMKKERKICPAL